MCRFSILHFFICVDCLWYVFRRARQGELRQRRKRRCPGVRPRRAVPLSRQMLFIRVHFPCAGEQCSPLRDNHVQVVNKRCAESSHPTVYLYYNIKTEKHGKPSHIQTNRFAYFQRVSSQSTIIPQSGVPPPYDLAFSGH